MMTLTIPYPPSGNHAVKHGRNRHYSTQEVRRYRSTIHMLAMQQRACNRLQGPLQVVAEIRPPDRRRRDMDNVWKTVADALTHAGVWEDDFQIADLRLIRAEPVKGGQVDVMVEEL